MRHYVGIDLGTTNSAIATFDGKAVRLWKSPEQNDVTPSALLYQKRGGRLVGIRAYDSAPKYEDAAALRFKRLMGTGTPISLPAAGLTLSPEQCSAEILRTLFGYLPEEVRRAPETGTVITVPAAFSQMQKDATLQAAELAELGKVALMQEPVAAVMSVMRGNRDDGIFVIYDLGGGTLDIAIAESIGGRVTLHAHGGIAMCGGRDFDRALVTDVVAPWLRSNFDLPDALLEDPAWRKLVQVATWATERAKIELSANETAVVRLDEREVAVKDRSGSDVYFEVEISRQQYDRLISQKVDDSIRATKETLARSGFRAEDVKRGVVFVGGPTQYKPLRDRVCEELGVRGSTEVNPMTAVAEGAAVFAESIDWSSSSRSRKGSKGSVAATGLVKVSFVFNARTTQAKARVVAKVEGPRPVGAEFQVDSLDTGWTSGRLPLSDGTAVELQLPVQGEHQFKVFAFDSSGASIPLESNRIVIARTAATIDAIPASHSVFVEALDKMGGRSVSEYLLKQGDPLPKKGKAQFKAGESLRAQTSGSINIKLWEGEIKDVIHDNEFVGSMKIVGTDFEDGVIAAGDDLVCEYEITDSGLITLEVSVPRIGASFHSGRNYYSRQDGQVDFTAAGAKIVRDVEEANERLDKLAERIDNPKIDEAREKLSAAAALRPAEQDPETAKQARDDVLEAKKLLADVRMEHSREIRQIELDELTASFDKLIRPHARPAEIKAVDALFLTAQRAVDTRDKDFENIIDEVRGRGFEILWRQDWFVVGRFKSMVDSPDDFLDRRRFAELVQAGVAALQGDQIDRLREVVQGLARIRISGARSGDMFEAANILRG
ncbi:MAG: Hsp70 family protein [Anaeromyxobacter sp.]